MMAMGVMGPHAFEPTLACSSSTTRISSVAYAVEEMAALAKTGSAIFVLSRW